MRDIYLFGALGCGFKTALLVTSIFTYCNKENGVFNYPKSHIAGETGIHMNWVALLKTTKSKACSFHRSSLYQTHSNKNKTLKFKVPYLHPWNIKPPPYPNWSTQIIILSHSKLSDTDTLWDWKWHLLCTLPALGLKCSKADAANLITEMEEGWWKGWSISWVFPKRDGSGFSIIPPPFSWSPPRFTCLELKQGSQWVCQGQYPHRHPRDAFPYLTLLSFLLWELNLSDLMG